MPLTATLSIFHYTVLSGELLLPYMVLWKVDKEAPPTDPEEDLFFKEEHFFPVQLCPHKDG